jgi:hypothetical protein
MISFDIHTIVSILIMVFLAFVIINHFFKDLFKLIPFYRNNILLEGFDVVADPSGNAVTDPSGNATAAPSRNATAAPSANATAAPSRNATAAPSANATAAPSATATAAPSRNATQTPSAQTPSPSAQTPSVAEIPDTEKSTIMVDLFEKVNNQMDTIRTMKLSDKFIPINIDKTASEPFVILMNLKLLINNGIYKNELDLKEMYDKYIGNKAIQVLTSDINSVNMNSNSNENIGSLESSFLTRCRNIVAAHQTIIDQILENKSKE